MKSYAVCYQLTLATEDCKIKGYEFPWGKELCIMIFTPFKGKTEE